MSNFITINTSGQQAEKAPTVQSTGVANAADIVGLDSSGRLDPSVLPVGVGPTTVTVPASEALAAGAWVNLWLNSGVENARNADASGGYGKKVDGFVLSAVASGANALVYTAGLNNARSGLTTNSIYFLSASAAGGDTATPVTASGQILQVVGKAVSATAIAFQKTEPVIRA